MPNEIETYLEEPYRVYVQTDARGCIVNINSSAFLDNIEGWIEIDRGYGDKYHHAQGNYFPDGLYTMEGIPRYIIIDGAAMERPREEIDAEIAAIPPPVPVIDPRDLAIAQLMRDVAALKGGMSSV